jgi:predicted transcriptional regulator
VTLEPLDVDMRRRVLGIVNAYPGLHLRGIQRRAATSAMLVEYHLNVLERLSLVVSHQEGGYRRFFPVDQGRMPLNRWEKRWLSLLRQRVPLGVVLYLVENAPAAHKDIAAVVPVTKGTLTYHLKNMESAGLVERDPPREGRAFRLADRERVLDILRAYHPTPDLTSAYGDMWAQIFDSGHEDDEEE